MKKKQQEIRNSKSFNLKQTDVNFKLSITQNGKLHKKKSSTN